METVHRKTGRRPAAALMFALFTGLLAAAGLHGASDPFAKGTEAMENNDYHSAIYYFRRALEHNPNYLPAKEKLGWAYYYNQAFPQSEKVFVDLLRHKPKNLEALIGLAKVYTARREFGRAFAVLSKGRDIDPYNIEINYSTAVLYADLGKIDLARRRYTEILRTFPEHVPSIRGLADIQMRMGYFEKALRQIERAESVKPNDFETFLLKGRYYLLRYKYGEGPRRREFLEKARLALLTAHGFEENNPLANYVLGQLLYRERNYDGAYTYADRAFQLNDTSRSIVAFRAEVLRRAVESTPENAQPLLQKTTAAFDDYTRLFEDEDFGRLVYGDFLERHIDRDSHQKRIEQARYFQNEARQAFREHNNELGFHLLRESLSVYPNLISARIEILNAYLDKRRDLGTYVDGLKALRRAYPGNERYMSALRWALDREHESLYFKTGFKRSGGHFNFKRSDARIFVFHFSPEDDFPAIPSGGEVISAKLNDVINTFGRISGYNPETWRSVHSQFSPTGPATGSGVFFNPEKIGPLLGYLPSGSPAKYILYGSFREKPDGSKITLKYVLYDIARGTVVDEFSYSTGGEHKILRSHIRAARRLFKKLPLDGRVLKTEETGVLVVNIGSIDGVKPGDRFVLEGDSKTELEVTEAGRYISRMKVTAGRDPLRMRVKNGSRLEPAGEKGADQS